MIHSRVRWMLRPVERSMTVSAPQRIAHTIFSTSSSTEEVTAELPILALILVAKFRPMIIGSDSGGLILAGGVVAAAGPCRRPKYNGANPWSGGPQTLPRGAA